MSPWGESGADLKSWNAQCGAENLHRKKLWIMSSLPLMGHTAGRCSMMRPSLSYPLDCVCGCFCFCVGLLVFLDFFVVVVLFFSPEHVVPYVLVDSVCLWEELNSGSFYNLS